MACGETGWGERPDTGLIHVKRRGAPAGYDGGVMEIRVECYAGHRGEETPRVLLFDSRRVEVTELLDQWLAPDHRYFKVKADDGALYIIRHDTEAGRWSVTLYDRLAAGR